MTTHTVITTAPFLLLLLRLRPPPPHLSLLPLHLRLHHLLLLLLQVVARFRAVTTIAAAAVVTVKTQTQRIQSKLIHLLLVLIARHMKIATTGQTILTPPPLAASRQPSPLTSS